MLGRVASLSLSPRYTFSKDTTERVRALPTGTRLELGPEVVLELTGLRNPCGQLNAVGPGLMKRLVYEDETGATIRRGGVMSIVLVGGEVARDDEIRAVLPDAPHRPLERV